MLYFLEQFTILLAFTFIGNGLGYLFYYWFLSRYNSSFNELTYERKLYNVKNITKATFLAYLTIYTSPNIYTLIRTGVWNNDLITWMGHIYVSTDIAGLFFVRELPKLTRIHHSIVFFLGTMSILADYGKPGIHRNLVALTYFSIIPYSVNCLLGTKDLQFHPEFYRWLAVWSSFIYGICIACNFIYQHISIFFYNNDWWPIRFGYLAIYHLIFLDDRNLMMWLYKVARNPQFSKPLSVEEESISEVCLSENSSI